MANQSSQPASRVDSGFSSKMSGASEQDMKLGDISGFDGELNSQHSIGNLDQLDGIDEADELLGDISLLDEAIAELEADADDSGSLPEELQTDDAPVSEAELSMLELEADGSASIPGMQSTMQSAASDDNVDVPTLTDAISHPIPRAEPDSFDMEGSVPLLNEVATDFEPPELHGSAPMSGFNPSEASADDFADLDLENISLDSGPDDAILQASEARVEYPSDIDSAESKTGSSYVPLEVPVETSEFVEDMLPDSAPSHYQERYSEAVPDSSNTLVSKPAKTTEHRVKVGTGQGLSISIPYELHAQLSKKIDSLVIEATTSLTEELHNQLSARLEGLLGQAVEAVLPNLIDQMANGLRTEVKARVRQQLPSIINDVLGKTSLKE